MEETILKTYKRDSDSELGISATRLVEGMDNNPSFPDPPTVYAEMKKLLPDYLVSVANAKGRHTVAVSHKKDLKAKMVGYIIEIDAWVTEKCKGDRTMLLSSGFYLAGEKGKAAAPTVGELEIKLGAPGFVTTSIKRVRGTKAYLHQVATEQPTSATLWTYEASANPEFTFSGLISGKTYWMRVAILSSTGKTVYSGVKSCIIQ